MLAPVSTLTSLSTSSNVSFHSQFKTQKRYQVPAYSCLFPKHMLFSLKHVFFFFFPATFTQLSRWQSCHHAVQSHSGHSDPQQSTVSGCCLNGPAALLPQYGSLGPSQAPDFSADRHTDLGHCFRPDNPPISDGRRQHEGNISADIL